MASREIETQWKQDLADFRDAFTEVLLDHRPTVAILIATIVEALGQLDKIGKLDEFPDTYKEPIRVFVRAMLHAAKEQQQ